MVDEITIKGKHGTGEITVTEQNAERVKEFAEYGHVPGSGKGIIVDGRVVRDDNAEDNDIEMIDVDEGVRILVDADELVEHIEEGLKETVFGITFIDTHDESKTIPLTAKYHVEENSDDIYLPGHGNHVVSMYDDDIVDGSTTLKDDEHKRGEGFDASWYFEDAEIVEL